MRQVGQEAAEAILGRLDRLAEAVGEWQLGSYTGAWVAEGFDPRRDRPCDIAECFRHLCESLAAADPGLFLDHIQWARLVLAGRGAPNGIVSGSLHCMREILSDQLEEPLAAAAGEYITRAIRLAALHPAEPPSHLAEEGPLAASAREYLQALLSWDGARAFRLPLELAEAGVPTLDLSLQLLQPAQKEIGRLWQLGRVGVAQEHFATGITQAVLARIGPIGRPVRTDGRRLVAACPAEERHDLGLRMVADTLALEGWEVCWLGGSAPAESVLDAVRACRPSLVAISATSTLHLGAVAAIAGLLRAALAGGPPRILVGGHPFRISPGLWRQVGGDAWAEGPREAVAAAARLCPAPAPAEDPRIPAKPCGPPADGEALST